MLRAGQKIGFEWILFNCCINASIATAEKSKITMRMQSSYKWFEKALFITYSKPLMHIFHIFVCILEI